MAVCEENIVPHIQPYRSDDPKEYPIYMAVCEENIVPQGSAVVVPLLPS